MASEFRRGYMKWEVDGKMQGWMETTSILRAYCETAALDQDQPKEWRANFARAFRVALNGGSLDREFGLVGDRPGRPRLNETGWPSTLEGGRDRWLAHEVYRLITSGSELADACESLARDWNQQHASPGLPQASPELAKQAWMTFARALRDHALPALVNQLITSGKKKTDAYRFAANRWNDDQTAKHSAAKANAQMAGRAYRKWPVRPYLEAARAAAREREQGTAVSPPAPPAPEATAPPSERAMPDTGSTSMRGNPRPADSSPTSRKTPPRQQAPRPRGSSTRKTSAKPRGARTPRTR